MKYIKPKLTKKRRDNFFKLAFYLYDLIPTKELGFDMCGYEKSTECGTVACACGHGPYAGIEKKYGEGWYVYIERCFAGATSATFTSVTFDWCFSEAWKGYDNTAKGAAKRIFMMLEYGIPEYNTYNPDIYKSYEPKYLKGQNEQTPY